MLSVDYDISPLTRVTFYIFNMRALARMLIFKTQLSRVDKYHNLRANKRNICFLLGFLDLSHKKTTIQNDSHWRFIIDFRQITKPKFTQ